MFSVFGLFVNYINKKIIKGLNSNLVVVEKLFRNYSCFSVFY